MAVVAGLGVVEEVANSKYTVKLGRHDEGINLLLDYTKSTDTQVDFTFELKYYYLDSDGVKTFTDEYFIIDGNSPATALTFQVNADGKYVYPIAVPQSADSLVINITSLTNATLNISAIGSEPTD